MKQTTQAGQRARWIAETAVLIALLVVLQGATASTNQFITGSCVNTVLGVAALVAGLWSGVVVALVSPFFAYLLGIGPQLLPIVPAVALGNVVLVLLLWLLAGKKLPECAISWRVIAVVVGAAAKALTLYLVVVQVLCRVLSLADAQVATFSLMFSWPQLVTALIGGTLSMYLAPVLRKALKR
ncbi:MAG: hypothetical protein LUF28_03225 [Clostridiales bacterium]|nr:hypothetical protein [Clostridiales bacterium]